MPTAARDLRITIATVPYDRTEGLRSGTIRPRGLVLDYQPHFPAHEIFLAMAEEHAYDASEMSLSLYLTRRARNDFPFIAIPVFPSRYFRHGAIFVHAKSGIRAPKDLEGRRIGIQEYRQTAAVWVRGMLRDDYGVDTASFHWVEGGINTPREPHASDVRPDRRLSIEHVAPGRTLSAALAAGEIDALISARTPDSLSGSDTVRRLFPDYRAVEQDYFRRTRIFPIMHTFVIREDLWRAHPWMAKSLFDAFEAAKAEAVRRMRYTGAMMYMTPWLQADVEEMDRVFGGDPWVYGLAPNRAQLETFLRYLAEDGFLAEIPRLDDLFAPMEA